MKAILVIDIPDDIWKNKDEELGMCCEVWSMRIDDGWCGEYYADSLKSIPKKLPIESGSIMNTFKESTKYRHIGFNQCIDEILGGT